MKVVFAAIATFLAVTADQVFKSLALDKLPDAGVLLNFPFQLVLHKNYGIAFDIPVPSVILILLVIILIAVFNYLGYKHFQAGKVGLTITSVVVIGGAVGNLIDRVIHGFTVDYILLFGQSVINVADIMIVGGIAGMIILLSKKT